MMDGWNKEAALSDAYDNGYEDGLKGKRPPRVNAIKSAIAFWRLHNQPFHAYWKGMLDGIDARKA
ncbi:MAG: hypothetical protein D6685_04610 [Bacteroidetes bacterium]|nr:hypothetical protein AWN76_010990 [Rhodothermaceae bacterium RA]RMH66722.1 MAG: hypothetical protein D6685_04610 [Bacteroidota bacterium]